MIVRAGLDGLRERGGFFVFLGSKFVAEFALEGADADAEHFGGAGTSSAAAGEGGVDGAFFDIFERHAGEGFVEEGKGVGGIMDGEAVSGAVVMKVGQARYGAVADVGGQVVQVDDGFVGEDHHAFDDVEKFADVAGPGVFLQGVDQGG